MLFPVTVNNYKRRNKSTFFVSNDVSSNGDRRREIFATHNACLYYASEGMPQYICVRSELHDQAMGSLARSLRAS